MPYILSKIKGMDKNVPCQQGDLYPPLPQVLEPRITYPFLCFPYGTNTGGTVKLTQKERVTFVNKSLLKAPTPR